jgi:hypothetical protein
MGITSFSISLIEKYKNGAKNVCELGAQNLYDRDYGINFPYADKYYSAKGMDYTCIDINGENGAIELDLENPQEIVDQYDLVTDFGTSEHVRNSYNTHKVIHELTKEGGIIIRENPKSGNWPGHGFNYYTKSFYEKLAEACGYEILELGEHPAMGNTIDGWNVYCVLKKVNGEKFISKSKFDKCGIQPK